MEEKLHTMHCYVVQRLQNRLGVSPSSCPQGLGKSGGFAAAFFLVYYIYQFVDAERTSNFKCYDIIILLNVNIALLVNIISS